jgi:multimeric flavodoxin WrbA
MIAFALNCTLKPSPQASSTDTILESLAADFAALGVALDSERVVDHHVKPGVTSDEGDGDEWPDLLRRIMAADIFVLATPIWLGHPASTAQRVLERLDALLGDTDGRGQMRSVDKVAVVAVVGNEDGAHHVGAELFQGLNDVGFTIPANGMTYWVGEAMQRIDLKDKHPFPDKTAQTTRTAAVNAFHMAASLAANRYPSLTRAADGSEDR